MGMTSATGGLLTALGLIVVLAGLDLLSALFAKEWSVHKSWWLLAAGLLCTIVIYVVFALGLKVVEMSTLAFGWIIVVESGIVIAERVRYGQSLPVGKWFAIAGLMILQGYLLLGPSSADASTSTGPSWSMVKTLAPPEAGSAAAIEAASDASHSMPIVGPLPDSHAAHAPASRAC